MKKLLALTALLLALALITGCGSKVTVTDKEIDVKVKTPEGDVESKVSDDVPTEAELGLPVYPDAEIDEETSGSVETTTEEGTATFKGVSLITDDDFDAVVAWYREKLSGMAGFFDMTMGQADSGTAVFSVGTDKTYKVVTIEKSASGNTKINVASSTN